MTAIRIRAYPVIERAVNEGLRHGLAHARKHTDTPDDETLLDCPEHAVMSELCEVVELGEEVET